MSRGAGPPPGIGRAEPREGVGAHGECLGQCDEEGLIERLAGASAVNVSTVKPAPFCRVVGELQAGSVVEVTAGSAAASAAFCCRAAWCDVAVTRGITAGVPT